MSGLMFPRKYKECNTGCHGFYVDVGAVGYDGLSYSHTMCETHKYEFITKMSHIAPRTSRWALIIHKTKNLDELPILIWCTFEQAYHLAKIPENVKYDEIFLGTLPNKNESLYYSRKTRPKSQTDLSYSNTAKVRRIKRETNKTFLEEIRDAYTSLCVNVYSFYLYSGTPSLLRSISNVRDVPIAKQEYPKYLFDLYKRASAIQLSMTRVIQPELVSIVMINDHPLSQKTLTAVANARKRVMDFEAKRKEFMKSIQDMNESFGVIDKFRRDYLEETKMHADERLYSIWKERFEGQQNMIDEKKLKSKNEDDDENPNENIVGHTIQDVPETEAEYKDFSYKNASFDVKNKLEETVNLVSCIVIPYGYDLEKELL